MAILANNFHACQKLLKRIRPQLNIKGADFAELHTPIEQIRRQLSLIELQDLQPLTPGRRLAFPLRLLISGPPGRLHKHTCCMSCSAEMPPQSRPWIPCTHCYLHSRRPSVLKVTAEQ